MTLDTYIVDGNGWLLYYYVVAFLSNHWLQLIQQIKNDKAPLLMIYKNKWRSQYVMHVHFINFKKLK